MSGIWEGARDALCQNIENKFNIKKFRNKDLPIIALTSNDKISTDGEFGERMKKYAKKDLATIGDAVIDYLIIEHFTKTEHSLTAQQINEYREQYGKNEILHKFSKRPEVNLPDDIIWTNNDRCAKTGKVCLAVYFEALVAAIFLDHGIEEVKKFFTTIDFFNNIEKLKDG